MKHRFFTLLTTLLLTASALFAQSAFSPLQIEAALEDELYLLAEEQIWSSLSIQRSPEEEAGLTILLIRSLMGQQRFSDAVILAEESVHLPKQEAFAYWKARAHFEAGDFQTVFQTLETLPKASTFTPATLRLSGRAASAMKNLKAAEKSFALFEKKFPDNPEAAQNLLDLAGVQLERNRKKPAAKTMRELLDRFPDSSLADSVRLLLARELIADGGKTELKSAAGLLEQLGASETALPRLRVAAWVELAVIEQRAERPAAAAEALLKAETLTDEAALRVRQKAARANLLIDQGKTEEALTLFDEAIETAPDEPLAANILLQKADALLKTGQFIPAEKAFQAYLNVTTDAAGEIRALFGKGWSLWEQKRYEEAAVAFQNSAVKCDDPDHCTTARMKAGDAFLAVKQAETAYENYLHIFKKYTDHPLAGRAVYQGGLALLTAGKTDEARCHFQTVETEFPDNEFAPRAALQLAELFKLEKNREAALQEYQRIASKYTNAVTQATALHQQGLIRFELTQYSEALDLFSTVVETYPASPEASQALYMRGRCYDRNGDIEAALDIFQEFISLHPDSPRAPDVHFLLGEHAYNCGDYAKAQKIFLDILERFPQNDLADDALFWAGNALLQQDSFLDAFTLYSRLAKEYPESDQLTETRFAQGEALTELGEFTRAILAYEEVIKTAPDAELADRARGRLGDCLFTLGSTEAARYREALDAYQALYKRPSVLFKLKLQALYKIARCEEKMGLPDKAFAHYMEAVYEATGHSETLSPEAVLWFTRAAFAAAARQEQQNRWKEAVNIYERIIEAGVPAQDEASKRIEKIRKTEAFE